ncbi:hypothetical protein LMG29739_00629 [Paraburkholderia solisilvae]|uniref:Uncharacterized protein n=1 Tax=Paraburkholderia solisilvae TaxID=624376 RepID=A0A6J5D4P7_9BURK|nr:hypothetical protein LMG29739_00629 [Paraburkholderia solisilvae]
MSAGWLPAKRMRHMLHAASGDRCNDRSRQNARCAGRRWQRYVRRLRQPRLGPRLGLRLCLASGRRLAPSRLHHRLHHRSPRRLHCGTAGHIGCATARAATTHNVVHGRTVFAPCHARSVRSPAARAAPLTQRVARYSPCAPMRPRACAFVHTFGACFAARFGADLTAQQVRATAFRARDPRTGARAFRRLPFRRPPYRFATRDTGASHKTTPLASRSTGGTREALTHPGAANNASKILRRRRMLPAPACAAQSVLRPVTAPFE